MARALYHCNHCQRDWQGMSPMTARLGTGGPVHCDCGAVATLKEIIRVEIGQVGKKTAANITAHEAEWAEDDYHQNILMGAKALKSSPDWIYHTQGSSGTTLWWNTDGKSEATVEWVEALGWAVDIRGPRT